VSGVAKADLEAIWHDVECGAYAADLALWRDLAREAAGPVLELGCGTGRVALDLARDRAEVTGIDHSPGLVEEAARRATAERLDAAFAVADARELALGRPFALIAAPMQLAHLLGGESGRRAMLRSAAAHLDRGGRLAVALLAADALTAAVEAGSDAAVPLPDVREIDGWIYSSLPVEVRAEPGGVEIRRLRQAVAPSGELREQLDVTRLEMISAAGLEEEGSAAGLAPRERIPIAATDEHLGSEVVVLEAE
jgi:SAM-dependent methyltransferase